VNALVTLLDDEHAETVREIWSDIQARFGIGTRYAKPFVHFSYHVVADEYDLDHIEHSLEELAKAHQPLSVRTGGLEVFMGTEPVLFAAVERNPELDALQKQIWEECTPHFGVGLPFYAPDVWVPHVTLAQGPRTQEALPELMEALRARNLEWDLRVDNLAVIEDGGKERGIIHQVALGS
jgi:2'-5' RNA ligase